jgi:hypothetical protein
MTDLLYNQYITGTKVLDIGGKISHYKTTLPWLGPLRELDFGLFIAAISAVIKDVSRDSPWNASAFVMEHDTMTTQSFCSGFPWDSATTEVTAAATRAVFGKEIDELSALQYAHYAACSGGVLPLLDASPGGAQVVLLMRDVWGFCDMPMHTNAPLNRSSSFWGAPSKSARRWRSRSASCTTAMLWLLRRATPASQFVPLTVRSQ